MYFKEVKLPRQRPSKRRLDICEFTDDNHQFTEVEKFHRVTHYCPALDKIILELKTRFAENDNKVLSSLGKILTIAKPDDESFKVVSEFYSLDEDSLRSNLKILAQVENQHFSSNCSIPSIFKNLMTSKAQMMMPEISKALKIYSVIPATSCSVERSFSCLWRLKHILDQPCCKIDSATWQLYRLNQHL